MTYQHKYARTQPGQPRGSLYGQAATANRGGIIHADNFGTNLAMRSRVPPPVAEYDAYLKSRNVAFSATNHRAQITGYRLRRIVIMRRAGSSWKECADATGLSVSGVKQWAEFLPLELAI